MVTETTEEEEIREGLEVGRGSHLEPEMTLFVGIVMSQDTFETNVKPDRRIVERFM